MRIVRLLTFSKMRRVVFSASDAESSEANGMLLDMSH